MSTFEFRGPLTNLGRFGMVKTGERLVLTDKEVECIRDDKRFKAIGVDIAAQDGNSVAWYPRPLSMIATAPDGRTFVGIFRLNRPHVQAGAMMMRCSYRRDTFYP